MTSDASTHLDGILAGVAEDLEARKREISFADVEARALASGPGRETRLRRQDGPAIIAEIKRASPSRGWIARGLDAAATARCYESAGAAAISVLTEGRRFGGSLRDLEAARAAVSATPLLRKDFLLDEYMVAESRAHGADLVLLMVSVLGERTAGMLEAARRYGLGALVEVHDEDELEVALAAGAPVVGINNRNLKTLAVDLATSVRLLPRFPPATIRVVESGITTPDEVSRLAALGADAFLVGETLVRSGDPAEGIRRLLSGTAR